jgi:hypothetical protein
VKGTIIANKEYNSFEANRCNNCKKNQTKCYAFLILAG